MEDDDNTQPRPDSLLPYEVWAQEAMRGVAVRALHMRRPRACPASTISTSASAPTRRG